MSTKDFTLWFY